MCGIAGLWFKDGRKLSLQRLKAMTDVLAHRGPDGEGHFIEGKGSLGLGHRRLSILDLSDDGKQPMQLFDTDRYTITFNGEIYNYVELKQDLIKKGIAFKTGTDTEVLLRLFQLDGERSLDSLDGMFAFAIWDQKERKLFCARDRFGEKPFFYYSRNNLFAFASETKALFKGGIDKRINHKKLTDYLLTGNVKIDSDNNFFEDVQEIPAGHFMVLNESSSTPTIKSYWSPRIGLDSNYGDNFESLFQTSIKRRLRSDVPVGSSLSGGLDSSAIVATINKFKQKEQIQKTFSARFPGYHKDESKFIDMVSSHLKVENFSTFPSGEGFQGAIEKLFYHQEFPFQHASIFAQFEVMKLAAQEGVTVLLDGQGADEYLAGYHSFFTVYLTELYVSNQNKYKKALHDIKSLHGIDRSISIKKKLSSRFPKLISAVRPKRTIQSKNKGLNIDYYKSNARSYSPQIAPTTLKESLCNALSNSSLPTLLRYADRNSMAHSREVRLPFLNHNLVEYALNSPNELLIHDGWTKYILRDAFRDVLPDEVVWRKEKVGYEPPQEVWLKTKEMVEYSMAAFEHLKKEGIITTHIKEMSWKYLMADLLLKS